MATKNRSFRLISVSETQRLDFGLFDATVLATGIYIFKIEGII